VGLNDEMEKLRQAEAWLDEFPAGDYAIAAWEHVSWVADCGPTPELRAEARRIVVKAYACDFGCMPMDHG
jgi:hypothetical protein